MKPSTDRELVAGFAFVVPASPADLVKQARAGLLDKVDPNTIAFHMIEGAPGPESFAKLTLQPGAEKRAKGYVDARPGGDFNLSSAEVAAYNELGSGATPAEVEKQLRSQLLERLRSYQTNGLAGIAPYARGGGKERSAGDELRSASRAAKVLENSAPAAHRMLLNYPADKPTGTEEAFRWSHFEAHGVPTITLTHSVYVPDGDGWVVIQRQFYATTGYNCEQAIAALIPVKKGTLVVYANRTSTDQVTGFGGGAKRSIGSKMLASQLEGIFSKIQQSQ